jgi:hypothetical protein
MRFKQQYVFSHFRLDASTMPITPKRLAVHVKKMMDIMYRSQTLSVESTNRIKLMVTKTAPSCFGSLRILNNAVLLIPLRKCRTRSCRNRCRQRGCSLRRHPCPCPCRRPCCRARSATGCRSRRNVAAGHRFAVVVFGTRRWAVERAVRVVASRRNAEWTFAASRWR